jgi:hypothetical protein
MREHLHQVLLRLAGWLPDDVLTDARARLADDRPGEVAMILTFAGRRTLLPMTDDDVELLAGVLAAGGVHPDLPHTVEPETELAWEFAPSPAVADDELLVAELARADLVAAVSEEPTAHGLWRAWRIPGDGSPYPPPRAVYVVAADGDLAGLAGRLQRRLTAAGDTAPQVEVVAVAGEPLDYQREACERGSLLWASAADAVGWKFG